MNRNQNQLRLIVTSHWLYFKIGDTAKSEEEFKKIAEKNPNFVQSFLYLYEIAKLRENKQDIAKYKSIVFSLDETIAIE